jgi:TATA-box binding protein (TBP) (component of TFIID and TFIIIB)
VVIKDEKGTLVLFGTGKFRVMGCIDELEAAFLAYKYIEQITHDSDFPDISIQSFTSVAKLGHVVNLNKLSECDGSSYHPELFAAVRMTKYKPLSVNVFHTGSVVVCGLKTAEYIFDILNDLKSIINKS